MRALCGITESQLVRTAASTCTRYGLKSTPAGSLISCRLLRAGPGEGAVRAGESCDVIHVADHDSTGRRGRAENWRERTASAACRRWYWRSAAVLRSGSNSGEVRRRLLLPAQTPAWVFRRAEARPAAGFRAKPAAAVEPGRRRSWEVRWARGSQEREPELVEARENAELAEPARAARRCGHPGRA